MFRLAPIWPAIATWLLLGLTALGPAWAADSETDWRDLESRIQYAWYTEDARDLQVVESRVAALLESAPRAYYLTLIQLHEAQLALALGPPGVAPAASVGQAASRCISSADDALAARPTDAELLALQAACMDLRSRTRSVDVPFAGTRSQGQMQRAVQLAPGNPRVRLLAAQLAYLTAHTAAERGQVLPSFQGAVDAFESERQGMEHGPAWGGAEAYEGMARIYLDRGDALAARSALEHALLLVPDYVSAHRLLKHILAG